MLIRGQCHCGNVAFELEWDGEPPEIPARACGCSFCVKHGGVWTSSPRATLAVTVRKPEARIEVCIRNPDSDVPCLRRCGVVPLVTSEIDNHVYAVVNVNALENVDPAWLQRAAASFEGEDVESRLARRKRNWIAKVRFADPGAGSK